MVNKYRGEVALPDFGEGAFIAFDLDDLVEIESIYGFKFFDAIEEALIGQSVSECLKILRVSLRRRAPDGSVEKIGAGFDFKAKHQEGYNFGNAAKPILDALSMAQVDKTYDELVKIAEETRKKQLQAAISQAKEAAAESDVPFEALLNALLLPQTA